MSMIEKQVIFIMFTMGIVGGLSYFIWYRRKRLAYANHPQPLANSKRNSVEPRLVCIDPMAEKIAGQTSDVAKNVATMLPRQLLLNAKQERKTTSSSSLPTTPLEKVSVNKHTQPSISPEHVNYIVTIKIPLWLVSRFIGKRGCTVKALREQTGADFRIIRKVTEGSHTACNIVGSKKQIDAALNLIRRQFPEVTLPNNPNMKLFHGPRRKPPVVKQQQQSVCNGIAPSIIPSTPFLASISSINSLNSIWIQVVDPSGLCPWQELYEKINSAYTFASAYNIEDNEEEEAEIPMGQFYAVRTDSDFVRGLVKDTNEGDKSYKVFLVDYGNHINVTADRLIPLRYAIILVYVCAYV